MTIPTSIAPQSEAFESTGDVSDCSVERGGSGDMNDLWHCLSLHPVTPPSILQAGGYWLDRLTHSVGEKAVLGAENSPLVNGVILALNHEASVCEPSSERRPHG